MNNTPQSSKKQASFSFQQILSINASSHNSICLNTMFIDICDYDILAGLLLSQITYWFGNNSKGEKRARHKHKGRICIVKEKSDWWDEIRLSERIYDRVVKILIDKGFITTEIHYNPFSERQQKRATFIFLNEERLTSAIYDYLNKEINERVTNDETVFSQTPESVVCETNESGVTIETNESGVCSYNTKTTTENTLYMSDSDESAKKRNLDSSEKVITSKPKKPPRSTSIGEKLLFGTHQNVEMTQADYDRAVKEHGVDCVKQHIEELDIWIGRGKGKGEKDHYLTLLTFIRNAKNKEKATGNHRKGSKLYISADSLNDNFKRRKL